MVRIALEIIRFGFTSDRDRTICRISNCIWKSRKFDMHPRDRRASFSARQDWGGGSLPWPFGRRRAGCVGPCRTCARMPGGTLFCGRFVSESHTSWLKWTRGFWLWCPQFFTTFVFWLLFCLAGCIWNNTDIWVLVVGLLVVETWTVQPFPEPTWGFGQVVSWKQQMIHVSMSLAVASKSQISNLTYLQQSWRMFNLLWRLLYFW